MFGKKLIYRIHVYVTWTDANNLKECISYELYESWLGKSFKVKAEGFTKIFKTWENSKEHKLAQLWKGNYISLERLKTDLLNAH